MKIIFILLFSAALSACVTQLSREDALQAMADRKTLSCDLLKHNISLHKALQKYEGDRDVKLQKLYADEFNDRCKK